MKPALIALTAAVALGSASPPPASGHGRPEDPKTHLRIGDLAPDFTLPSNEWKPVTLSGYRGKSNVILAFYAMAFTGG